MGSPWSSTTICSRLDSNRSAFNFPDPCSYNLQLYSPSVFLLVQVLRINASLASLLSQSVRVNKCCWVFTICRHWEYRDTKDWIANSRILLLSWDEAWYLNSKVYFIKWCLHTKYSIKKSLHGQTYLESTVWSQKVCVFICVCVCVYVYINVYTKYKYP